MPLDKQHVLAREGERRPRRKAERNADGLAGEVGVVAGRESALFEFFHELAPVLHDAAAKDDDLVVGVELGQAAALGQRVQHIILVGRQVDEMAGVALAGRHGSFRAEQIRRRLLAHDEHLCLPLVEEGNGDALVVRLEQILFHVGGADRLPGLVQGHAADVHLGQERQGDGAVRLHREGIAGSGRQTMQFFGLGKRGHVQGRRHGAVADDAVDEDTQHVAMVEAVGLGLRLAEQGERNGLETGLGMGQEFVGYQADRHAIVGRVADGGAAAQAEQDEHDRRRPERRGDCRNQMMKWLAHHDYCLARETIKPQSG